MKSVIFDIDGTIADHTHRLHHILKSPKDYDAFYDACDQDWPIEPIIQLVIDMYARGYKVLIVSGRTDRVRDKTVQWLTRHMVPYHHLYMRKHKDFRQDYIIKGEILDEIIEDGYNIMFAVDDRNSVVKMWRERGIICLQCREYNE